MTHRDGFPRLSAGCAWRGGAGDRQPCARSQSYGPSESLGKPPPVAQANRQRANRWGRRKALTMSPHRPRLPSYPPVGPTDRPPDLYGSLSTRLGIRSEPRGPTAWSQCAGIKQPSAPAAAAISYPASPCTRDRVPAKSTAAPVPARTDQGIRIRPHPSERPPPARIRP